ncbi:hypothetical protein [Streptomyces lydicus]|uniref:hypothetical protein n=1 Tax=Streptomyces lydicus TaxID=47763 RepID=UPI001F5102FC|nr:hypothetical protein [Streptomyces lydicus]
MPESGGCAPGRIPLPQTGVHLQDVGDRPESSQPVTHDSTVDFGVGAFLPAGTELAALGAG